MEKEETNITNPEALYERGTDLFNKGKERQGLNLLIEAAEAGNGHAMGMLAYIYWGFIGNLGTNFTRAFEYASQGIELDDPLSELVYGLAKIYGKGTNKAPILGMKYLNKAKKAHSQKVSYHLGVLYFQGQAVEQDIEQSIICLEDALKENRKDLNTYIMLGKVYDYKISHQKTCDIKAIRECIDYNTIVTEMDPENADAYTYIGSAYMQKKDYIKALEFFRKGAELNNSTAAYWCEFCYKNGYGCLKDKAQAKYYKELTEKLRS